MLLCSICASFAPFVWLPLLSLLSQQQFAVSWICSTLLPPFFRLWRCRQALDAGLIVTSSLGATGLTPATSKSNPKTPASTTKDESCRSAIRIGDGTSRKLERCQSQVSTSAAPDTTTISTTISTLQLAPAPSQPMTPAIPQRPLILLHPRLHDRHHHHYHHLHGRLHPSSANRATTATVG